MRVQTLALVAVAALAAVPPAAAQQTQSRAEDFVQECERWGGRRDSERVCQVRDSRMAAGERLFVDARENGSVRVFGADRSDILVRALIQAWGDTRAEAEGIAKEVSVQPRAERLYADGPSLRRYQGWSVSYEVWVPRRMNVEAETHNGSVSVTGVQGRMDLRAVNGGIRLAEVGGDVRAETTNGSVSASLTGATWAGSYLDMQTTNGSVVLEIPRGYNALLETSTVNGGMNIDFPITVQGSIGRRISTKLGNGGPRVRAETTNGSVRIREIR